VDLFNPFPGLRPFEADEDHLFFGRETEIDDLLRRLRSTRFLAVVGPSGSGKSSLVRSGLIPSLQSGYMSGASSTWRIAVLRPGEDPIGNLAAALSPKTVLGFDPGEQPGEEDAELAETSRVLLEATLRRSALGLANAVRQAHIPNDENVLVLVDQFEELFRFRRSHHANSRDEAVLFVRLLIEAARQHDRPIYVVLTMRSDFIGDCMDFPGLSEMVNAGMYLVGRMSRDAVRSAINGPIAVGGGTVAPRLVHRVLNDLGDDQDQLPLVQHALMRTWDHWERNRTGDAPLDVEDYEAVGTFRNALSVHAEEAYQEAVALGGARTAERVFKALTDTFSDARGVRRPTAVHELAGIAEVPEADVVQVAEVFRREGRTFLMPPPAVALGSRSIVDLSHESLMRCWVRLIDWAREERASADFYVRLSRAASWFEEGSAGLWRNPELELAQRWKTENQPTAAWAARYDEAFDRAMAFLDRSLEQRERERTERERERRLKLRRAQVAAGVLAIFLVVAVSLAYIALRESDRATKNLALARAAVDQSLSSAERDPARVGADPPPLQEFRRELLVKAETFYRAFMSDEPDSEASRRDLAVAHFRLGHINRLLEKRDDAAGEYQRAITGFEGLASDSPANPEYRAWLANAHNWMGETLRPAPARFADAERAYNSALLLQQTLVEQGGGAERQQELARTYYNRGILRSTRALEPGQESLIEAAGKDFRAAIRLLEPLAATSNGAAQELARAYNNLGGLIDQTSRDKREVRALWERAIAIDERLSNTDPANREYKLELAYYCNNLAVLLRNQKDFDEANRRSRQAVDLVESLAEVGPLLGILRADAHSLRGMILEGRDGPGALAEYEAALALFEQMSGDQTIHPLPDFQLRFGDLLINLARFAGNPAESVRARALFARAVGAYADMAARIAASGSRSDAQTAFEHLSGVLEELPEAERAGLKAAHEQLKRKLGNGAAR
jgi:tetratricopeptide (TPR) repeat protein/energy-coupling factor transporter ATP-binding protein EcfA2